uniref:Uncharacterized protein n=1 Tax=Arundo donax TaxID=35708 RepID=A0A0A8YIV7_ARUDO
MFLVEPVTTHFRSGVHTLPLSVVCSCLGISYTKVAL